MSELIRLTDLYDSSLSGNRVSGQVSSLFDDDLGTAILCSRLGVGSASATMTLNAYLQSPQEVLIKQIGFAYMSTVQTNSYSWTSTCSLYGSQDQATWTLIDSWTPETMKTVSSISYQYHNISTEIKYKYYRIDQVMTGTRPPSGSASLFMYELYVYAESDSGATAQAAPLLLLLP